MRGKSSIGALLLCGAIMHSIVGGGEIGFIEDFALAPNRAVALQQLIPGTDDYYYYHALHYQNAREFEKVEALFTPWVERHGNNNRVGEIRMRQALLTYDKDPRKTLDYLRNHLNLQFNHQRQLLGVEPNLPTTLDPDLISRDRFQQRAMAQANDHLNLFDDSALDWLITLDLNAAQRRQLLIRLQRPDYAVLPKRVVDDLNHPNSGGFGSMPIHGLMLLAQLEEIVKLKPTLLNETPFVTTYVSKLVPSADDDWQHDPAVLQAYLERLQAFADRLSPVHNSLKALVLHHRLVLDRQRGVYDKERFLAYLALPRRVGYLSKRMAESEAIQRFPVDLNNNYGTLLNAIGNDDALVRSYLAHFLLDAADAKEFEPFVDSVYLRHLLAEVKITAGLGDNEQWASLLPPALFQQLKDRVDIDFAFTNKTRFTAAEPIALDLHVKNVGTLIVKVFEINTKNYYRGTGKEIDTDVNLDGLTPNIEQTLTFTQPPLLRTKKRIELPQLKQAGVYVIDFIGNGRSSRALLRKGRIEHLVRTGPGGHVFTVLDEAHQPVNDAVLWLGGQEYKADKAGAIHVPFSTAPGVKPIVITVPTAEGGSFSSLERFEHQSEAYQLGAAFYVDRESLLTRRTAKLLVRSLLTIHGTPVSIKRLEEIKLTVVSTDLDGIQTSQDVPNFPLFEDRESIHEFQVPPRTAQLQFRLTAKATQLSEGDRKVDLVAADTFTLNGIDRTDKIEDLHLVRNDKGYVLELRGKTGEAKVSRPIGFVIKHRDFNQPFHTTLKTDPTGRIALGQLPDIAWLEAVGPEQTTHRWMPKFDRHTYAPAMHAKSGEKIEVPFLPRNAAAPLSRDEVSLLELRGERFTVDRFANVSLQNGLLTIEKLPPGDFDLWLKTQNVRIRLRVGQGDVVARYVVGPVRRLETSQLAPLQIESAQVEPTKKEAFVIQLRNASKFSRVHLFAVRMTPQYDSYEQLASIRDRGLFAIRRSPADSVYLTGRNIGDEYRYILDRKYAKKFPGNMLERPALLLHPWAVRDTETGEQISQGGDEFAAAGKSAAEAMAKLQAHGGRSSGGSDAHFANLDFLALGSSVLVNLQADENGRIEIDLDALGGKHDLHVVAVDPLQTTYRTVSLSEGKADIFDLRLLTALPADGHFTQQKQITLVKNGGTFVLDDIATGKFETYDSLARAYSLLTTLNPDANLIEFEFLTRWLKLKDEEKKSLYSKYACHELNFFLSKKDPAFFEAVVAKSLVNKRDQRFLDQFLLGRDLQPFVQPWMHGRLNMAERILLGRRIKTEQAATARHISDLYSLLPPNVDRFIMLFDTAVKGTALQAEAGSTLGLDEARKAVDRQRGGERLLLRANAAAAPPAPGAAKPAEEQLRDAAKDMNGLKQMEKRRELAEKKSMARDGKAAADKEDALGDADRFGLRADRDGEAFLFADLPADAPARQLYRKLEKTKEWAENNYYHLTIDKQNESLIPVNAFWRDVAKHDPAQPFLSPNFAEASHNFPSAAIALALLDLPAESPKHTAKFEGAKMTLTAAGPMIVYHEEIKPAAAPEQGSQVLVSQNYFRNNDRYRMEEGERHDKFVTEEFVVHAVYGCQVVITNPTSSRQKLNLLMQIPAGAIPVLNSRATRTVHLTLEPYHTQTIEYHFYFPMAGEFGHFPVHVAKNEKLIAAASPTKLNVVEKPTKIDVESWDYISQNGTDEQVSAYLDKHNVNAIDLGRIAWRMKDVKFFEATIARLAARHVYHDTLWSYSILHNAVASAREFLQHSDPVINLCGGRLRSPLLDIDPVLRRTFEHLEYKPLVNARSHALGKRRQIVNDRLQWQYHRFLKELSYEPKLSSEDLLASTYYLLLQDRVEEGIATFDQVEGKSIAEQMQYDYCAAYVAFFRDQMPIARQIAAKYANYPVDRWRNTFAAVTAQLDEAEGKETKTVDAEDRNQQQTTLAATEPSFETTVEAQRIRIDYQNLKSVRVNFYEMDVELLFSRSPFVQNFQGQFSFIRPNRSQIVALPEKDRTLQLDLPQELRGKNVLVETEGAGRTRTQTYYSHSLAVQTIENYGQVKVAHQTSGKPVPKAYVKVYARTADGRVKFYKDGYTDLRGRFDYASISNNDADSVAKFSILIMSDEFGALVREVNPPQR